MKEQKIDELTQAKVDALWPQTMPSMSGGDLLEQAVAGNKQLYGEKDRSVAYSLIHLALAHQRHNQYAQAAPLFEEAARLCEDSAEKGVQGMYFTAMMNLGIVRHLDGKTKQAIAATEQGLAAMKDNSGEIHPEYARGLRDLSDMYESLGEGQRAKSLRQRAEEIDESLKQGT